MANAQVLIVDDDFFAAEWLSTAVEASGCTVIGPAGTASRALELISLVAIDAALLDLNLGADTSELVAAALTQLQIPFALVTAYSPAQLPEWHRGNLYLQKPSHPAEVQNAIRTMIATTR